MHLICGDHGGRRRLARTQQSDIRLFGEGTGGHIPECPECSGQSDAALVNYLNRVDGGYRSGGGGLSLKQRSRGLGYDSGGGGSLVDLTEMCISIELLRYIEERSVDYLCCELSRFQASF